VPDENDASGIAAGKPATICVPEALSVGNLDAPSITAGLLPKPWPLITRTPREASMEVLWIAGIAATAAADRPTSGAAMHSRKKPAQIFIAFSLLSIAWNKPAERRRPHFSRRARVAHAAADTTYSSNIRSWT
jgi:hypothetical protein